MTKLSRKKDRTSAMNKFFIGLAPGIDLLGKKKVHYTYLKEKKIA
jgi:hypothetical protein